MYTGRFTGPQTQSAESPLRRKKIGVIKTNPQSPRLEKLPHLPNSLKHFGSLSPVPRISNIAEEHLGSLSPVSRISNIAEERNFVTPTVYPEDFFPALSYCMRHTKIISEALSRMNNEVASDLLLLSLEKETDSAVRRLITALRLSGSDSADVMLESLFNTLRGGHEFANCFQEVEITECEVYTHKFKCNASSPKEVPSANYLKAQIENCFHLDGLLKKRYSQKNIEWPCKNCTAPGGQMVRERKILKIGQVLIIIVGSRDGMEPEGCFPSINTTICVSSNKKSVDCRKYSLSAALSYNPSDSSVSGHFMVGEEWIKICKNDKRPADVKMERCFFFIYTQVISLQENKTPKHSRISYLPALYALLLRDNIFKLCFKRQGSPLNLFINLRKNWRTSKFSVLLKNYFSSPTPMLSSNPSQFLKHFIDTIYQQDGQRAAKLFTLKFELVYKCNICAQIFSKFPSERIFRLPSEKSLQKPNLFSPKAKPKPINARVKKVSELLKLMQQPANEKVYSSFCKKFAHWKYSMTKILKECGSLIVFDFSCCTNGTTSALPVTLHLEDTIKFENNEEKSYTLKAVVKQDWERFSTLIIFEGVWYSVSENSATEVVLPETVKNIMLVIYEEVDIHSLSVKFDLAPLPEGSLQIEELFLRLGKRLKNDILSKISLRVACKAWLSGKIGSNFNTRSIVPTRGFVNIGNSCSINAVMNCLYYCNEFFHFIISIPHLTPEPLPSPPPLPTLKKVLSYIFNNYQYSQADLSGSIHKVLEFTEMELNEYNDARFFYTKCILLLERDKDFDSEKILNSMFQATTLPCGIYCAFCSSILPIPDNSLTITIPKAASYDLEALICDNYQIPCKPGQFCKNCRSVLPCSRIIALGSVLVIFLSYSYNTIFDTAVSYPMVLDMNKWLEFSGRYKLFGAVMLIPDHAFAVVNIAKQWWSFDDEKVTSFQKLDQVPGKTYLLFYEKFQAASIINIALPSTKPIWYTLAAFYYVPAINIFLKNHNFAGSQDNTTIATGQFFQEFQHQALSHGTFSQLNTIYPNCQHPSAVVNDLLSRWIRNIENYSETFRDNTAKVNEYLKMFFYKSDNKCSKLHKMCTVLVENQYICSGCFNPNSIDYLEPSYILNLEVPQGLEEVKRATVFKCGECYFPSISQIYKSKEDLADYCSKLKRYHPLLSSFRNPIPIGALDLYACIQYKCRLYLNRKHCFRCRGETLHYTQQFIRFLGTVLIISLIRDGEGEEATFDKKVKFPYHLDLSEFVQKQAKYELKSFICTLGEAENISYEVTVNVDGSWYTFAGDKVTQVSTESHFYEKASVLFYEKIEE